jgi:hypothetical protein
MWKLERFFTIRSTMSNDHAKNPLQRPKRGRTAGDGGTRGKGAAKKMGGQITASYTPEQLLWLEQNSKNVSQTLRSALDLLMQLGQHVSHSLLELDMNTLLLEFTLHKFDQLMIPSSVHGQSVTVHFAPSRWPMLSNDPTPGLEPQMTQVKPLEQRGWIPARMYIQGQGSSSHTLFGVQVYVRIRAQGGQGVTPEISFSQLIPTEETKVYSVETFPKDLSEVLQFWGKTTASRLEKSSSKQMVFDRSEPLEGNKMSEYHE